MRLTNDGQIGNVSPKRPVAAHDLDALWAYRARLAEEHSMTRTRARSRVFAFVVLVIVIAASIALRKATPDQSTRIAIGIVEVTVIAAVVFGVFRSR